MSLTFTQTDTDPAFTDVACSAATEGAVSTSRTCSVGGTPGSGSSTVGGGTFDTGLTRAMIFFKCVVPADTTWGAGDWTVNVNVTTAQASVTWTATYICRMNSSDVSQETLGSLTGQTTSMATTGTKTHTVNQAGTATPSVGDYAYIVVILTAAANNRTIAYTPSLTHVAAGYTAPVVEGSPPIGAFVPPIEVIGGIISM